MSNTTVKAEVVSKAAGWADDKLFGAPIKINPMFDGFGYDGYWFPDEPTIPTSNPAQDIVFTPHAANKLLAFLEFGNTEVGGFGVSTKDNPLRILDIHFIPQKATSATIEFDDNEIEKYLNYRTEKLGESGLPPIWIHTHPGASPHPSGVDEVTFKNIFANYPWSVMFIISRTHATYARLQTKIESNLNISSLLDVDLDLWGSIKSGFSLQDYMPSWERLYKRVVDTPKYASSVTYYNGKTYAPATGGAATANPPKTPATPTTITTPTGVPVNAKTGEVISPQGVADELTDALVPYSGSFDKKPVELWTPKGQLGPSEQISFQGDIF